MVIHDLKHPSDSLQRQLGEIFSNLTDSLNDYYTLTSKLVKGKDWEQYKRLASSSRNLPFVRFSEQVVEQEIIPLVE
jgi:proline dehydrogenase